MSPKPARAPVLAPAAGAVSCVGNMRPAPEWESGSFFGVHSQGDPNLNPNPSPDPKPNPNTNTNLGPVTEVTTLPSEGLLRVTYKSGTCVP